MEKKSLGIFDSGLGGLTVLKEIMRTGAYDRIVYFGDTGRVPYGTRSRQTIISYAMQDVRFLLTQGVDEIIVACGTVSTNALAELRAQFSLPIEGVIEVSAAAAARATKNKKVGVIGTKATIASGVYPRRLCQLDSDIAVTDIACPLFVPLVEYGFAANGAEVVRQTCAYYLEPLRRAQVDTLILGCTHYPILAPYISEYLGEHVQLINSGVELAAQLGGAHDGPLPEISLFVSDGAQSFASDAEVFLAQKGLPAAQLVDIQSY